MLKVYYDRQQLEEGETQVMRGALQMKSKLVDEIMTPLDKAFMLPITTILNFEVGTPSSSLDLLIS